MVAGFLSRDRSKARHLHGEGTLSFLCYFVCTYFTGVVFYAPTPQARPAVFTRVFISDAWHPRIYINNR